MVNILLGAKERFGKRSQRWLYTRYGPWAIVTGASSGIGREMALKLAEAGLNLVLCARSQTILEQMATDLTDGYGIKVQVVRLA